MQYRWPNLAAMMLDLALERGERPVFRFFAAGAWQRLSWTRFAALAAAAARGLTGLGVAPGDRVVIVSENRPEFAVAELALLALRTVPVPTYVTNTVGDHAHILRDSGARLAIASRSDLAARIAAGGREAGTPVCLVVIDSAGADPAAQSWERLTAAPADPAALAAAAEAIEGDSLAALMYTSGTGGAPKGVMLPHRAILANCRSVAELLKPLNLGDAVYLSILPMSHAYEHTLGLYVLPAIGAEVVFARDIEHLAADMLAIRPTIVTLVPRVLEVIRARILAQMSRQPAWRRALFHRALALGLARLNGQRMVPAERLLDLLLDRLVRKKIRARFGGRLRAAVSGGARLEPEIGRFFLALGVSILQGYGQTEAGPVISVNPPGAVRIDTVGPPLPGVEVAIAADGEILTRGEHLMAGYWKQPETTRATLRDGWLHTGDVGEIKAGYLRITDRKKDIIVLSGGENVSPARIEGLLIAEPEIAQAVVGGEGQSGLIALIVPSEGTDAGKVAATIARVNARLSVTERIRHHRIAAPFTIDNGLLTPTQKVRRHLALAAHVGGKEASGT